MEAIKYICIFALLTLNTSAWAENKDSSKESSKDSTQCYIIKDDNKRLKCYDASEKAAQNCLKN